MKILVVEDDRELRRALVRALELEGYEVAQCGDGEEALYHMESNACDAVVLDRMLPGLDGVSALRAARAGGGQTPVLILSAMDNVGDRVAGLDAGADDYLPKPFEMSELLARVRALVRRPAALEASRELCYGDLCYVPATALLRGPAGEVNLSRREGALLELFLRAQGATLTRQTLFNRVWGPDSEVEEGNIATYAHFLRRRLVAVGSAAALVNRRGVGFALLADGGGEGG